MHHHLQAIFRESNGERYYEIHVATKARTVRTKEPRKPSRKLIRIRTKSLPGFRMFSTPLMYNHVISCNIMIYHVYKCIQYGEDGRILEIKSWVLTFVCQPEAPGHCSSWSAGPRTLAQARHYLTSIGIIWQCLTSIAIIWQHLR